ncbi:MAG: putative rane protein [Frankiales bacterium]|nr:putative rane protein [Frankiales bacterium]
MRRRRLWYVAAGLAVPMLVFGLWLGNQWAGAFATRAVDDLGLLIFAASASVCSLWAAQKGRGRQRRSWLAMGLGLGAWTVGEVIWCYYELWRGREQAPFPSAADPAFLLFPVGAAAALFLFPAAHRGQSRTRLILDGVIVAGSLFVISWVSVLGGVYRAGGDSHFAFDVSLAYPIADLVTVTMTILVLARAHTTQRLTLGLLATGVVLMAFSDSAFVYLTAHDSYHSGSLIDLGWLAAFSALGLAALSSTHHPTDELESVRGSTSARLWLPYLPLVFAGIVGVHRVLPGLDSGPLPLTAVILVIAMLVRQFVVLADNRRLLATVERQAFHDPLTGLANRALFTDRLDHAVRRQNRDLKPLAVLCLDLDDFKLVNDTLGHPAGDELLIRVAERLIGCLRSTDTVARLGGDEFAILVEEGAGDALLAAARVLETFQPPFTVGGRPLAMHASVGLTIATAEATDVAADDLLKQADLALYAAKKAGGSDLHIYTPQLRLAAGDLTRELPPVPLTP